MSVLTGSWEVVALIVMLCILYWRRRRNFSFWEKLGVPCLKPSSLLGNMCGLVVRKQRVADPIYDCYLEAAGAPFVGIFLFSNPLLLVRDPQLLARVLSTDFPAFSSRNFAVLKGSDSLFAKSVFAANGDRWKTMRAILAPAFAPGKIQAMLPLMENVGQDLVQHIAAAAEDGTAVDVRQAAARYTAHVLCTAVLGADAGSLSEEKCPLRDHVAGLSCQGGLGQLSLGISYLAPQLFNLLSLQFTEGKEETFLYFTTIEMMDERMRKGIVREDMVDMLMRLRGGQATPNKENPKGDANQKSPADPEMDDETIVGNIVAFLHGGLDTSAWTLTYALYELAANQEIQESVRQDTREAIARHGGHFTYEALAAMSQLDNVVDETLRLHPPVTFLERQTTRPFRLPGSGAVLPTGTGVVCSVLGLHRDARYWEQPDRFLPARFSGGGRATPSASAAFLPFGDGPRRCLGWRLAQTQIKIALAKVLLNFRVAVTEKTPAPPTAVHRRLIRKPKDRLELRFQKIP